MSREKPGRGFSGKVKRRRENLVATIDGPSKTQDTAKLVDFYTANEIAQDWPAADIFKRGGD
jgi:hypothetical protein